MEASTKMNTGINATKVDSRSSTPAMRALNRKASCGSYSNSSTEPLSRSMTRKDSLSMFADAAALGNQQKKMMMQSKMLQMRAMARKQNLLKEGAIKNILKAPSVAMAFKQHVQSPFVRFRRVARAVKLLIQVCHVCKSLLEDMVAQEAWFALVDNIAAAAALTSDKKKGKPFVTSVQNEKKELEKISFDVSEFIRHKKAERYLTDDIRTIMKQRPGTRSDYQLEEVVRCMKNICKSFNQYPHNIQKQICQSAFYDHYGRNRVILRQGLAPDGIYFLLSGQLVEKPEGRKEPKEIDEGQKFGEEDLICGSSRRATVLSKDDVEILYLHRFDYRKIFNMSADTCDPKNLDICKTDAVFQHFPLNKLNENPGTWSALKYKYGRLIVKNSNDIEWIYVIKSGEARVLIQLTPGRSDVKARRKKVQQAMEEQSSYHKKKKILDFIADGTSRKSCYSPSVYHPPVSRPTSYHRDMSPRRSRCNVDLRIRSQSAVPSQLRSRSSTVDAPLPRPKTSAPNSRGPPPIEITVEAITNTSDHGDEDDSQTTRHHSAGSETTREIRIQDRSDQENQQAVKEDEKRTNMERAKYDNPITSRRQGDKSRTDKEGAPSPLFVQIETLHPGHTFGLRSCLESEERGPSVSLVSGDCEVLAINKKFFMKHCDDALLSLIKLKAKPFPSETELEDRLDANMQWEEFKQETLKDFLKHRIRVSR